MHQKCRDHNSNCRPYCRTTFMNTRKWQILTDPGKSVLNTGSSTWMPGASSIPESQCKELEWARTCSLDAEGPCVLWTLLRTRETHLWDPEIRSFQLLPQSLIICLSSSGSVAIAILLLEVSCEIKTVPGRLLPFGPQLTNENHLAAFASTTLLYIGPWTLQFQWYSQDL